MTVTVVAIEKVIVEGSNPEDEGPVEVPLGLSIGLRAKRTPTPIDGPWPDAQPKWQVTQRPSPFVFGRLFPHTGGLTTFVPEEEGTWKVKATCCGSEDEIEINVVAGCSWVSDVSADSCYERVDSGPSSASTPMNVVGPRGEQNDVVTLTVSLASGGDPNKVTWEGATQDANNPLKATVPIDVSVVKKVTVLYDGKKCREIHVWPVWANVTIRIDDELSPDNNAPLLDDGNWPDDMGGGKSLGEIDVWSVPSFQYNHVGGKIEAVALLSPGGIGDIIPQGKLFFRRKRTSIAWANGGHYAGTTWYAGPIPSATGTDVDDTSNSSALDINPAGNDKLFDLDVPGQTGNPQFHTIEMYVNFVQYVNFDACGQEQLCSNEAPWSYESQIDYDKQQNKVDLNKLRTSHITLPTTPHYQKR